MKNKKEENNKISIKKFNKNRNCQRNICRTHEKRNLRNHSDIF